MSLLTNSRAKAARQCARLHSLKYIEGWRPVETAEELDFGTTIHKALETWWLAPSKEEHALSAALDVLRDARMEVFSLCRAQAMIAGYHLRWSHADLHAVAVEAKFEGPLINPLTRAESRTWRLAGKLDVVARDSAGDLWLIEHKTSGENLDSGGTYWRRLRMDSQVSIYFDGARMLGHDVRGCIYDVLGKPAQKPLKATPVEARKYTKEGKLYASQRESDETPDEYFGRVRDAMAEDPGAYFARIEVPRLESELDGARLDLWQQAVRMREDERLLRAPRNPDACFRGNKPCPFWEVCSGAASLEDPSKFERVDNVNPELAGETNQPTSALERGESQCNSNNH